MLLTGFIIFQTTTKSTSNYRGKKFNLLFAKTLYPANDITNYPEQLITDSKMTSVETETCLVCHSDINVTMSPGLQQSGCGHWHCELCFNTLAEQCSICHREVLNKRIPCENCSRPTVMYQSRCCESCERLCCTSCSTASNCCSQGCVHAICDRCPTEANAIEEDSSDDE